MMTIKRRITPPPPGAPAGFITIQQAMRLAKCSESSIWRWIYQERLHTLRLRKRVLVNKEDLEHWMRPRTYVPEMPHSMIQREVQAKTSAPQERKPKQRNGHERIYPDAA